MELLWSLKRFKEADYVLALLYARVINQVRCSVGAVNLVAFDSFLVSDTAFLKHTATITVS